MWTSALNSSFEHEDMNCNGRRGLEGEIKKERVCVCCKFTFDEHRQHRQKVAYIRFVKLRLRM